MMCAAVIAASPATIAEAQSSRTVIATGLNNPRGLAFGPDGALYVVEAGRGGSSTLCLPEQAAPPGTTRCYGPTGAITRITATGQHRVATGLPSLAVPGGAGATGPHDISFGFGAAWVTIGLAADPAVRAPFEAAGIRLGRLVQVSTSTGQWTPVVDIAAHEAAANPDGGHVESNPYGLRVLSDRAVVADAGANALLNIAATGQVSTLAVFPPRLSPNPFGPGMIPAESVPTAVAESPDGNFYVGELTGFPFPVGGARIFRVPRNGGTPVVVAEGFTNIIAIAVDASGAGYILEHDADGIIRPGTAGRLTRVHANGTMTVWANADLTAPGGVVIGPDGAVYVTNRSTSAGGGEVVRFTP